MGEKMKRVYIFLVILLMSGFQSAYGGENRECLYPEQFENTKEQFGNQLNSYFYNLKQIYLQGNAEYFDRDEGEYKKSVIYAEIYFVKEYEKGSVYKFEIEPVGGLQYERLNQYFYVTENAIYRLSPYFYNVKENEIITLDDKLLVEVLDTDDKLIKESDIVCQEEKIESSFEEKEEGIYFTILKRGNQITYSRLELDANGETNYYENYVWEDGKGLIEYSSGFGAMRDILYITGITVMNEADSADK